MRTHRKACLRGRRENDGTHAPQRHKGLRSGRRRPRPSRRIHPIERTTPPSTRSAAPVVAEACGEET
jgi:hypothetical protein